MKAIFWIITSLNRQRQLTSIETKWWFRTNQKEVFHLNNSQTSIFLRTKALQIIPINNNLICTTHSWIISKTEECLNHHLEYQQLNWKMRITLFHTLEAFPIAVKEIYLLKEVDFLTSKVVLSNQVATKLLITYQKHSYLRVKNTLNKERSSLAIRSTKKLSRLSAKVFSITNRTSMLCSIKAWHI